VGIVGYKSKIAPLKLLTIFRQEIVLDRGSKSQ